MSEKQHRNLILLTLVSLLLGAPGKGKTADTFISGTMRAAEGGSLNGLVLIEKGRLYGKNFRYGGLVENGIFSVKVDDGGAYGLHLYATGYVYFPLGIQVESGRDNHGDYKLPPNPANAMAPTIENVSFKKADGGTTVTLKVTDPNDDLSHQVLGLNAATGEGFRMDPPGFVLPFARKYPQGVYTHLYKSPEDVDPGTWFFVAADNKCYNSPVLASPFTSDGVVPGRTSGPAKRKAEAALVSGQEVFTDNCSMCHLADSTRDKAGPGLKGLYKLDKTPALGNPLTDIVIRKQILEGGRDMPPYSHLTEGEVRAVMEYLKGL